jgi:hypothetical protein
MSSNELLLYRNFRLDNLKKHLRSNRHKINNEDIINGILEMVRSNSLPEETLLRVQNDNIVQVTVGSQLERTASTIPTVMQSAQEQNTSGSEVLQSSTVTQNLHNPTADDGELMCDQRQSSEPLPPRQPSQRVRASLGNRHLTDMAIASATDCIYDVQLRSLVKFINTPNPSTGRLQHCHLSFNKVSVEHVTHQVVNLRLLDLNGELVCVNGNQRVISRHEDPVPDYTISLGDTPVGDHSSDARGVFCHVHDFLRKQLTMSDETIGKVVTSSSSDYEAVYVGEIQGLQRLWKEKFNKAHIHFGDRAHKIESMIGSKRKDKEMKWLDDTV